MNNITPNPLLVNVVDVIKYVISDIKIEYISTSVAELIDGNAKINIKEQLDASGNLATINIDDPKDIIFSEDLVFALKKLVEKKSKAQPAIATIIINDLEIEMHLIFQDVKDAFDQLSTSYEFLKTNKKEVTKVKSICKFGSHVFTLTVMNEADEIFVTPEFPTTMEAAIVKIIGDDVAKVQKAVRAIFKESRRGKK
jgi:hypothetical protein